MFRNPRWSDVANSRLLDAVFFRGGSIIRIQGTLKALDASDSYSDERTLAIAAEVFPFT